MTQNDILARLSSTIESRRNSDPSSSYVAKLFHKGQDSILKKIGEEATEAVLASKDNDNEHIIKEVADLWFHSLVMLAWHNLSYEDVMAELARREGLSGLEEKASRPKD